MKMLSHVAGAMSKGRHVGNLASRIGSRKQESKTAIVAAAEHVTVLNVVLNILPLGRSMMSIF